MAETSYAIALGSNRRHGRHGAPKDVVRATLSLGQARGKLGPRDLAGMVVKSKADRITAKKS